MSPENLEDLLAEQSAQSVAITTLLRAVLRMAEANPGTPERLKLLEKWEDAGHKLLAHTVIQGIPPERQETVREKTRAKLTDIFSTATR